jgi:hypothetical protein
MSVIDFPGSGVQNSSNYYNLCDLELYVNGTTITEATTATLYIKCAGFFAFDLDLSFYQSTGNIITDKSYITTTPTGVLAKAASSSHARLTQLDISIGGGATYLEPGQIGFANGASVNGLTSYQLKLGIPGYSPTSTAYYPGTLVLNHKVTGSSDSPYVGNYTNTLKLVNANITLTLPNKNGTLALQEDCLSITGGELTGNLTLKGTGSNGPTDLIIDNNAYASGIT